MTAVRASGHSERLRATGARWDARIRADPRSSRLALILGVGFVVAGLPKFVLYGWELAAFRRFGMPVPELSVLIIGALEIGGGVLLVRRRAVVAVALLEAAIMAGAVVVSGIAQGDVIPSLTLAPALGIALIVLAARALRPRSAPPARGPGAHT